MQNRVDKMLWNILLDTNLTVKGCKKGLAILYLCIMFRRPVNKASQRREVDRCNNSGGEREREEKANFVA